VGGWGGVGTAESVLEGIVRPLVHQHECCTISMRVVLCVVWLGGCGGGGVDLVFFGCCRVHSLKA
jgi:hypothetical protein